MTRPLILHYAPDNASLCVRLACEAMEQPFETRLVNRRAQAQRSPAYLAMNPNGLIPVLETPRGPMHETGAILLWLADRMPGKVFPAPNDDGRGAALTRLFWLSNTLHPALRMTFYPDQYTSQAQPALRSHMRTVYEEKLMYLETAEEAWLDADKPAILACYLAPMLRWSALYGGAAGWSLAPQFPRLFRFAQRFEAQPFAQKSAQAEGLGPTPFSMPQPAQPPEGSPT